MAQAAALPQDETAADFGIDRPNLHGVPALTASLAIAEEICGKLEAAGAPRGVGLARGK